MLALAKPYSVFVAASPKSIYTILVLTPSILFSAFCASYRGYYEGFMNMVPTAVSQTIEALFKLIFGLLAARLSMAYFIESYHLTGCVLGVSVKTEAQALSMIYPVTSAFAMLGVTLGTVVSLLYVLIYHSINKTTLPRAGKALTKSLQSELFSFSLPIMISTAIQSVFQFLDTATVQYALKLAGNGAVLHAFAKLMAMSKTENTDAVTYAFGLFSTASDFKNLIPGITMALGVCAVPAVSAAFELKNQNSLNSLINEIYKYTVLLSVWGGIFLYNSSEKILNLFFSSSSPDIPSGCNMLVKYFALTVPFYCLAGTAVFCTQAIGKAEKCITPYVVCGIIRSVFNIILVKNEKFLLFGAVISGAAGYFLMGIWNVLIVKKYTKTDFSIKNILLKPVFIGICLTLFVKKLNFFEDFSQNLLINLLIEFVICSLVFCILCLLFKSLNVKEIFCFIKSKKNARNT